MIKLSSQKKFELISGSKFKKIKLLPKHRKFGNLFYSKLAKYLWKSELEDVLSGFKSYKIKMAILRRENKKKVVQKIHLKYILKKALGLFKKKLQLEF